MRMTDPESKSGVDDLDLTRWSHHHVQRLQPAVNDSFTMQSPDTRQAFAKNRHTGLQAAVDIPGCHDAPVDPIPEAFRHGILNQVQSGAAKNM